jgi:hypothetical protein
MRSLLLTYPALAICFLIKTIETLEPAVQRPEIRLRTRDADIGEHARIGGQQLTAGTNIPTPVEEALAKHGETLPHPVKPKPGVTERLDDRDAHGRNSLVSIAIGVD